MSRSSFLVIITPVKYYGGRNYTPNQEHEPTTHAINGIRKTTQEPPKTAHGPRRRFRAAFDAARSRWAFSSASPPPVLRPRLAGGRAASFVGGSPRRLPSARRAGFSPFATLRLRRPRVRFRPLRSGSPSRSCAPAGSTSLAQVAVRVWTRVIPAGSGCRNPPRKYVATAFYIPSPYPAPLVLFFLKASLQPSTTPRAFLRLGLCLAAGS